MDQWKDSDTDNDDYDDIEPKNVQEKFLWAAGKGNVDLMKDVVLSEKIAAFDWRDADGYTALHRAASEGQKIVIEYLLSCPVEVNARTNDGWTPLHCACKWNNVDVAQLLLQNGANVNSRSNGSVTPLHVAASEKNTREVLLLLLSEDGIDINIRNNCDETPFDLAKRLTKHASLFSIASPHINIY